MNVKCGDYERIFLCFLCSSDLWNNFTDGSYWLYITNIKNQQMTDEQIYSILHYRGVRQLKDSKVLEGD